MSLSNISEKIIENDEKSSYIDVVFVGDRSHSMVTQRFEPQKGITSFAKDQYELAKKGYNVYLTVYTFDNKIEIPYSGDALKLNEDNYDILYKSMIPRGSTSLYDAVIKAIDEQNERVNKLEKNNLKEIENSKLKIIKIFIVLTDGIDNSSTKTIIEMKNKINKHDAKCIFIGANFDAIIVGTEFGFKKDACLQMTPEPLYSKGAFNSLRQISIRSSLTNNLPAFTRLERQQSYSNDIKKLFSNNSNSDSDSNSDKDWGFIPSLSSNPRLTRQTSISTTFVN